MKKGFFVLTILAAILCQLFLPWWSIVFPGIATGYLSAKTGFRAFILGFIIIFLLWTGYSFYIDISAPSVISERTASLLSLPNKYILFITAGIIGGITAGIAAVLGFLWREHQAANQK